MLGRSRQAVGDGDQRDRPIYLGKVPDLIRIESISFARFGIDVNGPAVSRLRVIPWACQCNWSDIKNVAVSERSAFRWLMTKRCFPKLWR